MFKYGLKGKGIILLLAVLLVFTFLGNQIFASGGQEQDIWRLAAATSGGSYFALGACFAKILTENLDMKVQVQATNGSTHNIILVDSGQSELGLATSTDLLNAWDGTSWAKSKYRNQRIIAPLNFVTLQFFALKRTGINSVYDLEGKRVTAGEAGSTYDVYGREILKTLGVTPAKIINLPKLDCIGLLKDGLADAGLLITAVPSSAIIGLEAEHDISLFTLSEEDIQKLFDAHKYYVPGKIPKGSYKAVKKDLNSIKLANYLITSKAMDSEIIYKVTKAWFDNIKTLANAHPSARDSVPESIIYALIPLHPGAYKYYSELGLDVDHLRPSEMK